MVSAQRRADGAQRRESWRSPRRRLVALGLVAVLVHVAIVATAYAGMRSVGRAHADVARIVAAQRHFQDADMAHDAILASALAAYAVAVDELPQLAGGPRSVEVLEGDLRSFRADLGRVDGAVLPQHLEELLLEVRPSQEQYARDAAALIAQLERDPAGVAGPVQRLRADHRELTAEQGVVTRAMSAEATRLQRAATADERAVQGGLIASGLVALLGLLGITALLHRTGGQLATALARERDVATTLQHSLLPDRLPELPGVRLAARYTPGAVGTEVGGDWYDVLPLPGGRVGLVMGDVVGHDLHAAANMGQLRNALRACAADGTAPADVLHRLNRLSVTQDLGDMASVLYAVLDPVQGFVEIANAGHYPPLLVTAGTSRFLEGTPSPPVGVVREAQFSSSTWALPAGSLLLLFTDGLVERRGLALEPRLERLQDVVEAGGPTDLEQLCDHVLTAMRGTDASDDDVALLLVAPQAVLGPHVEVTWPAKAERLQLLRHLLERWLAEVGAEDDEVYDVLVACSEAATNAIEHAYGPSQAEFRVVCDAQDGGVTVVVRDWGQWREPRGRDRGRGLGLMEGLMDDVKVSHSASGTEVRLHRRLRHPQVRSEGRQALASP